MSYTLPKPSTEQQQAINYLKDSNVIISAVAGSGKTTCTLNVASGHSKSNILLLTYNAKLKIETREKVRKLSLNNIEVHSYHSFCVKYYSNECYTDYGIISILKENINPLKEFKYDIIILDEAQDISPLLYELVCKINKDNKTNNKMCILGDPKQSIYEFNNADPRFIEKGNVLYKFNDLPFKNVNLSESFRVTKPMAKFLNECVLKEDRIRSNKEGPPVRYIVCNTFSNRVAREIDYYLKEGYEYSDIFVLAPSVKSLKSPVIQLGNRLSKKKIPIYVPTSDTERIDEDIIKGKLVFSTFHQAKGLERKVVIVYNFDITYFIYYKTDVSELICPNEIYVALTRAKERLSLIHNRDSNYLAFLDVTKMKEQCYYENKKMDIKTITKTKPKNVSVTELIRFLPSTVIEEAMKYIDIKTINEASNQINIPIKSKQKEYHESVSEITGIAIPSYVELITKKKMTIYEELMKQENSDDECEWECDNPEDILELKNIDIMKMKISELLYISNLYNAYRTQYIFKVCQIQNYNWLSMKNLKLSGERVKKYISNESEFEVYKEKEVLNMNINGCIDCIDKGNVWEFKCVSEIDKTHLLQLAVYMYLDEGNGSYKIMNILSEEIIEITTDSTRLKQLVEYLVYMKYSNNVVYSDTEFMEKNRKIYEKYM